MSQGHTGGSKNFWLIWILFFGLAFSYLSSSSAYAAHTATITTSGSITLNVAANGSSDSTAMGVDNVTATTTCTSGYTLGIASSGSDRNLYLNGNSSNNTSSYTVINPLSSTTTLSTNKWGYSTTSSTISGNFTGLTSTSATIRTSNAATPVAGTLVPVYYGVKVANTATPGSYTMPSSGAIVYTLTMDVACTRVNISYDGNNATAGTMAAVHQNVQEGSTIDLVASNYSKTGYGFAGWSVDPNAGSKLVDNDNTNNPVVYGPQETVTIPNGFLNYDTDNDGEVKLYAVWIPAEKDGSNNPIYLQNWAGCANLDTATYDSNTGVLDLTKRSVTALTDMRDNEVYTIARLADGNCWMIENLRLEAEGTVGNNTIDSTVTNASLAQGYYTGFTGLATAEGPSLFNNVTTANSLYSIDGSTANTISGSSQGFRFPRYNNSNTSARASNPTDNTVALYSYGNYYTWAAAIADTSYYSSGDHGTTSICPAGWRLPIGAQSTADKSFGNLSVSLGGPANGASASSSSTPTGTVMSGKFRSYPNNFIYSGSISSNLVGNRGSRGFYLSSTSSAGNVSYPLSISGSGVNPGNGSLGKYYGGSIRCVIPSTLYGVHFDANAIDATGTMSDQILEKDITSFLNSNTFQRPATSSTAYRFVKWNTAPNGSGTDYYDGTSVTNIGSPGQTVTFYAQWEQVTPMTINYNANGLAFADSSTTKTSYYYNDCGTVSVGTTPRYSHTPNISDNGTRSGDYANNYTSNEVITITGASKLHIKLTYQTESTSYDWVSFWRGNHPNYTAKDDYASGIIWSGTGSTGGKYGGTTQTTLEGDINGDTVTFAFRSDSSTTNYGYYAVITALDANGNTLSTNDQVSACSRSLISGQYDEPVVDSLRTFYGWSENSAATTADYVISEEIIYDLPGNNGETKTLYAVWRNNVTINYNANGGTGTTDSQYVAQGKTITLKNSSTFTPADHKQFKNWNTAANGSGTSYNSAATYTAPASVNYGDSITLYAQWNDVYIFTFVNTALSSNNTRTKNVVVGQSGTVAPSSSWSRTGYALIGWDTVSNDASDNAGTAVYANSQSITPTSDMTFYTVWRPTYTVRFNSNGGSGSMSNQNIPRGVATALRSNSFTAPSGYVFKEWNTNASGTGTSYTNGQQVTNLAAAGETIDLYAIWIKTYTCTKRYRLQNADGSYPSSYTSDSTVTVVQGGTCSYSKSVDYYTAQSDSITNMTANGTISLDLPRTTYTLTINRNTTYISSVSGAGTYRWGESVSISATVAANSAFNGWSLSSGTAGTFNSASSASTKFTMGKGAATIYADGKLVGIRYNTNGSSVVGTMGIQSASAGSTVTLLASNYSRANYGFAGWNTKADGTGTNYGPNQEITMPSSGGLELYAKWVASAGNIQSWSGCSSLPQGSVTALKDLRDSNVYAVAKLADGNCWMIENLRIEAGSTTGTTNKSRAQGYNSSFTGLATAEGASLFDGNVTTANSLYSINGSTSNTISGSYQGYRFPRYNNTNTTSRSSNPTSNNNNLYSFGNYYTWAAAIADTTHYESGSGNRTTSICPKGWKLPIANSNGSSNVSGSFYYLNYKINNNSNVTNSNASKKLRNYPNNFIYSGFVKEGSFYVRGSEGDYLTSTAYNHLSVFTLHLTETSVGAGTTGMSKGAGTSIRCIAGS